MHNVMKSVASLVGAASFAATVSGCATSPSGVPTVDPAFIGAVQQGTALACGVIPTVESIIAVFNPGIAATAGQVTNIICAVSPPKTSRRFLALPTKDASPNTPAVLGQTGSGVQILGWRASAIQMRAARHARPDMMTRSRGYVSSEGPLR